MMNDSGVFTREFFDEQEKDDTLQKIRQQYLDSKRNLQNIMAKKQSSNETENFGNDFLNIPSMAKPVSSDLDERLRRELRNVREPASSPLRKEVANDTLIFNELRNLKAKLQEQNSQLYALRSELQSQKNINYELQTKVQNLESNLKSVEWEMMTSQNYYMNQNDSNLHGNENYGGVRQQYNNGGDYMRNYSPNGSFNSETNMNRQPNQYDLHKHEDSTARLLRISSSK